MTLDHYSSHGFFDAIANMFSLFFTFNITNKSICDPIEDSDYPWHPIRSDSS